MAEDNAVLIASLQDTKNEANRLLNIERARHAEALRIENALFEKNCADIQTVVEFVDVRITELSPNEPKTE